MFGVEVDGPITYRTSFEAAKDHVSVVMFFMTLGNQRSRRICAEIEAADRFFNSTCRIAVAKVDRIP